MADAFIGCRGGCGGKQPDDEAAARAGWRYLEITKGWRCGSCERALALASTMHGHGTDGGDALNPHDRGALPKETASTIMPPSVRG